MSPARRNILASIPEHRLVDAVHTAKRGREGVEPSLPPEQKRRPRGVETTLAAKVTKRLHDELFNSRSGAHPCPSFSGLAAAGIYLCELLSKFNLIHSNF